MSEQSPDPQDQHAQPQGGYDEQFLEVAEHELEHGPGTPVRMRHPRGLWGLFITEMWERFSFYGMRALLVLFLYTSTAELLADGTINSNPGFGWTKADAYTLYGVYTFMVYLGSIFGGVAADRLLGTHRSMLLGGWIVACGHITLALSALFHFEPGQPVMMDTGPGALVTFLLGLSLIIIGTGFFKPCVSVMVGQLYKENDPRRDSGFTIFYMGINVGAFFAPLVAGTLGEKVGWHWGFGCAAVGMLLGLFFYQFIRPRLLQNIGLPPDEHDDHRSVRMFIGVVLALIAIPILPMLLFVSGSLGPIINVWDIAYNALGVYGMSAAIMAVLLAVLLSFIFAQPRHERTPLAVILILAFFGNIFFWTAFEQAGSSLNIFALENTDRSFWLPDWFREFCRNPNFIQWYIPVIVGVLLVLPILIRYMKESLRNRNQTIAAWVLGFVGAVALTFGIWKFIDVESLGANIGNIQEFPATWYQSVNPLAILVFAPIFAWLWVWLEKRNLNPSTPLKFSLGLWLLGLAFLAMVLGALESRGGGLAGPHWLLISYIVVTWGELCLSPVGLSMVTKLAPKRLQSQMMGFWFFTFALANLFAGLVARFSTRVEKGEITFVIEGLPGFFLMLVVFPIGMGVLIAILTPLLKKMMHGVK